MEHPQPYIYKQLKCDRCGRMFDRGDYDNYSCSNCGKEIKWRENDDDEPKKWNGFKSLLKNGKLPKRLL